MHCVQSNTKSIYDRVRLILFVKFFPFVNVKKFESICSQLCGDIYIQYFKVLKEGYNAC